MLTGSRLRWTLLLLSSAVFAAFGVLIFFVAAGGRVAGVIIFLFFGACAGVAAFQLIVGTQLVLAADGFTVRSMGRSVTRRWTDVENFDVFKAAAFSEIVSFRYVRGPQSGLPDTFGMKASELAALMNEWRARYTGSPEPGS